MEAFEDSGVWWQSDQESTKIVGILRFDPSDGFRLEIPFGSIAGPEGFVAHANDPVRTRLIHGRLRNGKLVTLPSAAVTNWSVSLPGGMREEHRAMRGYIGTSTCDENPVIDRLRVRYSHLRDWVVEHPITIGHPSSGVVTYRYQQIEQADLVCDDGWRLELTHTATLGAPTVAGFTVDHDCLLVLQLDEACDFDAVDERFLDPLRQFFSFCLDTGVVESLLEIHLADSDEWLEVGRAMIVEEEREGVLHPPFMLLSKPQLGDRLAQVLRRWVAIDGDLRRAISLTVGLTSSRNIPTDLRFLAAAQALEAMSRVEADGRELPTEEHQRRCAIVHESIQDEVVRDWACQRLTYNRRSANDLLEDLLDRIGPFVEQLIPDRDRFLQDHRTNRNFYTHRDDPGRPLLNPGELYVHSEGVLLLLKAATLLMLGYSEDEIAQVMRGCQSCLQWTEQVAAMYAVESEVEPA